MTIRHRVMIICADEVSAQTRARLEAALDALELETTPAEANDDLAEPGLALLYVAAATTERLEAPDHPRAVRLLVTDTADPAPKGWLPLSETDIATPARPWLAAVRALGQAVDRPGLADHVGANGDHDQLTDWAQRFPLDPLAAPIRARQSPEYLRAELEAAVQRAQQAEQTALERDTARSRSDHDARDARKQAVAARNQADRLQQQVEVLKAQLEDTAWAPSLLRGEARQLVEAARQSVWRARTAAAEAARAAQELANPLTWPTRNSKAAEEKQHAARYEGESRNQRPDGYGVIRFEKCGSTYHGEFVDGRREGFGVGVDAGGRIWIGTWKNDQPHGYGALELPDGARLEGKVAPADGNQPAYRNLHAWPAPTRRLGAPAKPVFTEAQKQLPVPETAPPPAS